MCSRTTCRDCSYVATRSSRNARHVCASIFTNFANFFCEVSRSPVFFAKFLAIRWTFFRRSLCRERYPERENARRPWGLGVPAREPVHSRVGPGWRRFFRRPAPSGWRRPSAHAPQNSLLRNVRSTIEDSRSCSLMSGFNRPHSKSFFLCFLFLNPAPPTWSGIHCMVVCKALWLVNIVQSSSVIVVRLGSGLSAFLFLLFLLTVKLEAWGTTSQNFSRGIFLLL